MFYSLEEPGYDLDLRVGYDKDPNFPSCIYAFGFFPSQFLLSFLAESFNPLYTVSDMLSNVRVSYSHPRMKDHSPQVSSRMLWCYEADRVTQKSPRSLWGKR